MSLAWVVWALALAAAASRIAWRRLAEQPEMAPAPGAIVALCVLWQWQAVAQPALSIHLIGAMTLVLMLGLALAVVGMSIVITVSAVMGSVDWQTAGLTAVLVGLWPCLLAHLIGRLVLRLPANLFVFIFAGAFFGSWLVVLAVGVAVTFVLGYAPVSMHLSLWADYFPAYLLLGFSEAWISGMVVTLMVIYRPQWLACFDDKRYLLTR